VTNPIFSGNSENPLFQKNSKSNSNPLTGEFDQIFSPKKGEKIENFREFKFNGPMLKPLASLPITSDPVELIDPVSLIVSAVSPSDESSDSLNLESSFGNLKVNVRRQIKSEQPSAGPRSMFSIEIKQRPHSSPINFLSRELHKTLESNNNQPEMKISTPKEEKKNAFFFSNLSQQKNI